MMAIGFSLSSVVEILVDHSEKAIYFELKNVRYKIVIDDMGKAEDIVKTISKIIEDCKNVKDSHKELPAFYKDGGS